MMSQGTMGRGVMDDMRQSRMIGGMHMLGEKIMFAIVDRDGDGALSFEEVTAIHKRIFDKVNANRGPWKRLI